MNVLDKIKILFKLNQIWTQLQEAIKMANHNYFSSEFIGKILIELVTLLLALKGIVPANVFVIASASLTAIYMVCRTIYKVKNPGKDLPDLPAAA